ncbi:MAG: hypothetical protein ABR555_04850 [Pyrinomonadaceae bacterium]
MLRITSAVDRSFRYFTVSLAVLIALACSAIGPDSSVYARPKKAKYGTIKVLTTPGGFPVSIDGKSYGLSTTDYRAIDLDPGVHKVMVTLPSGQLWTRDIDLPAGRVKCVTLNYRPVPPPPPKSPCPFPVNISAPRQVIEGEIITYTVDVTYGGTNRLSYNWTITPTNARVTGGAGTTTVNVDSTNFAGQTIVATLSVDDGSGEAGCRQVAQASTFVPRQEKKSIVGREFDTCCSCSYDDQKARLDNLAIELQNDPSTTTYIFAYTSQTSPGGQANRLLTRARDYLVLQRGIDTGRIVLANGGLRERDCVEIWLVPQGATPPQPRPTVQTGDMRPATTPATNHRRRAGRP